MDNTPPLVGVENDMLVCPCCGARDQVYERDHAVRLNALQVHDAAIIVSLADVDFEHDLYLCIACRTPLSLPDDFEIVHL